MEESNNNNFVTLICNSVILAQVKILIFDGDIESNPGPTYIIEKAIHGSYHRGDQRLCNTKGVRTACNSLFALCWSQIRNMSLCNTSDFETLNTFAMLSVDHLSRFQ